MLEDDYTDVIKKALLGQKVSPEFLKSKTNFDLTRHPKESEINDDDIISVAKLLNLNPKSLINLARNNIPEDLAKLNSTSTDAKSKYIPNWLNIFQSDFYGGFVNNYLILDPEPLAKFDNKKVGIIFDTGTNTEKLISFVQKNEIRIEAIFITHLHHDHVGKLNKLLNEFKPEIIYSPELEYLPNSSPVSHNTKIDIANFSITAKNTRGHTSGGMSYIIKNNDFNNSKERNNKIVICGDSIFSHSIGRPNTSYEYSINDALENIFDLDNDAIICPGHGCLTNVQIEKNHNPFFANFFLEK